MSDRAEAARLRFLRDNAQLITQEVVEVLKATPVEAVKTSPATVDPLVLDILKELRRLAKAIEDQPETPAPVISVSPTPVSVTTPAVSVQPNVMLNTPRKWVVNVTEHYTVGPMYGKIKQVEFLAVQ